MIQAPWPQATVHTCVVHLVRDSLRFASRKYWKPVADHLKRVYQAPTVKAAEQCFDEFAKEWEPIYPEMIGMWRRSWGEFTPFLGYPLEIRKLIYTTHGIESLNASLLQATRGRDHFPNEQAALKVMYVAILERRANRANPTGEISGWKAILNTLTMTYGDRLGIN